MERGHPGDSLLYPSFRPYCRPPLFRRFQERVQFFHSIFHGLASILKARIFGLDLAFRIPEVVAKPQRLVIRTLAQPARFYQKLCLRRFH